MPNETIEQLKKQRYEQDQAYLRDKLSTPPRRLGVYEQYPTWNDYLRRHSLPSPFLAGARLFVEGGTGRDAEHYSLFSDSEDSFVAGFKAAQHDNAEQVWALPTCPKLGGVSMLGSRYEGGRGVQQDSPCGCHIDGMGILPDPFRVHRCREHGGE